MTTPPIWITELDVILFHRELIAAFGGDQGIRDRKLLQSALARPQNHLAYNRDATLHELAAVYAHGLAKNHPFVDGNKRIAFTVARIFLGLNGIAFDPPEADAVIAVEGLASGDLELDDFASWVTSNSRRLHED
ncbi:MAG: type II toxin-antitoxin system death-on-curing family toxin [Planctomycetes bacterium]|nr:type II toxin-antitoxin system death-on-curing family toxin [Planctomycetota bacterium]